jgi:uncharacterized protein
MLKKQIDKLLKDGVFPEKTQQKELVETHISWVILCDNFVYKIKKPLHYNFLDFSTLSLRKHFCEQEIILNRRFSKNLYLEVLPVSLLEGYYFIGHEKGEIIDYAVKMRKLNPEKQMDYLLAKNRVRPDDIRSLAKEVAAFHQTAQIIDIKADIDLQQKFNDLENEKEFLSENIDFDTGRVIEKAVKRSDSFLNRITPLLKERASQGFFRDCHGDLHTRNIFLLPAPQLFDCIEFNDEYRKIDVLNEVAFLCMDLDALKRKDLSTLFLEHYNNLFPVMRNKTEYQLFLYYKSYRANIRAKVNSLRASGSTDEKAKSRALTEVKKYLSLMENYLDELE